MVALEPSDFLKAPDTTDGLAALANILGINKDAFFGSLDWTERRMICEDAS